MTQTTVKCTLCEVQKSKWCECRCVHYVNQSKPIESAPIKKIQQTAPRAGHKVFKVRCINTKVIYDSAKEASDAHGVSIDAIMNCARGDVRTCKGLEFEYVGKKRKELPPLQDKKREYNVTKVRYIPGNKIYDSAVIAAKETGYGLSTIYTHAPRPLDSGKPKYFEYVQ